MKNGWIKLHRKLLNNHVFRNDPTAWRVFELLLLLADKKTGIWEGGRYQLSDYCKLKPTTTYSSLRRLSDAKMLTLKSNNKYTTIRICNWSKYQGNGNNANDTKNDINSTSTRHQSDTLTISKNKELRNSPTDYGKPEINEMFLYWQQTTGLPITANAQSNRNACNNLLKKHGADNLKRLIEGVAQAQSDQYAPRIANFIQLQSKADELILWGKKKTTKGTIKV